MASDHSCVQKAQCLCSPLDRGPRPPGESEIAAVRPGNAEDQSSSVFVPDLLVCERAGRKVTVTAEGSENTGRIVKPR